MESLAITPAHVLRTSTTEAGGYLAVATADVTCGQLVTGWATASNDGYTVNTLTVADGMDITITAQSATDLQTAVQALQDALVPTDAPPLSARQLELYPAALELDVNSVDINAGTRGNVHNCAVARAVGRRFDGAHVSVGGYEVRLWDPDTNTPILYRPLGDMSRFIREFDAGDPLEPTTFLLERVNPSRGGLNA